MQNSLLSVILPRDDMGSKARSDTPAAQMLTDVTVLVNNRRLHTETYGELNNMVRSWSTSMISKPVATTPTLVCLDVVVLCRRVEDVRHLRIPSPSPLHLPPKTPAFSVIEHLSHVDRTRMKVYSAGISAFIVVRS